MNNINEVNFRRGAAAIAAVAAVTLITRLVLRIQQSEGLIGAVSYMTQYFTILTNAAVLIVMVLIVLQKTLPPRLVRAVVVAIACVGIIYHTLLAHLVDLHGIDLWADHGTHTFVPLLSVIWWFLWAQKPALDWRDPVLWVIWPWLYVVYILTRASFSGFYPYPFLNLPEIGMQALLLNVAGLSLGFVVVGLAISGLARLLPAPRISRY